MGGKRGKRENEGSWDVFRWLKVFYLYDHALRLEEEERARCGVGAEYAQRGLRVGVAQV